MDLRSRSPWQAGCRDGEPKTYTKGLKQRQRKCCWLNYSQTDVQVEKNPFELGQEQNLAGWGVCPTSSKSWRSFWSSLTPWVQTQQAIGVLFCYAGWGWDRVDSLRVAGMGLCLSCSVWKAGGKSRKGGHWEWCVCQWLMLAKMPLF